MKCNKFRLPMKSLQNLPRKTGKELRIFAADEKEEVTDGKRLGGKMELRKFTADEKGDG